MRDQMYEHKASGATLAKPLMQPHVESFKDFFPRHSDYKDDGGPNGKTIRVGDGLTGKEFDWRIGPYCILRRNGRCYSLHVDLADCVLSRVRESMLPIENDTIYFEVVEHNNGWALVVANYNVIIGSHYLGYVRTDTVPWPS